MSDTAPAIPPGQPVPEPGVEPDGIDTPTLMFWSFISIVIVVAVMFGATAIYFQTQESFNAKRVIAPNYVDSEEVILRQKGLLADYREPTAEGDPYVIPIDLAMDLVLSDRRSAE